MRSLKYMSIKAAVAFLVTRATRVAEFSLPTFSHFFRSARGRLSCEQDVRCQHGCSKIRNITCMVASAANFLAKYHTVPSSCRRCCFFAEIYHSSNTTHSPAARYRRHLSRTDMKTSKIVNSVSGTFKVGMHLFSR